MRANLKLSCEGCKYGTNLDITTIFQKKKGAFALRRLLPTFTPGCEEEGGEASGRHTRGARERGFCDSIAETKLTYSQK
jgi:hypothetical protein